MNFLDWVAENTWWLVGLSVFAFVGTLILIPVAVVRMPSDYFLRSKLPPDSWRGRHPVVRTMIRVVKEGRKLLIFPEGRITVTGALMKVYEGPGTIADLADAQVLPIRIDGAQYTSFSRLKGKVHRRWFPKISITILAPRRFQVPEGLKGRARRQAIGNQLYDLMADMIFQTEDANRSLFGVLVAARRVHGGRTLVLEDVERKPVSYNGLIRSSLALGQTFSRLAGPGEHVGVLLPNSVAVVIVFMALQAFGRVPAMLNFSTGTANMVSACRAARITAVVSSRRFIALAKLEEAAHGAGDDAAVGALLLRSASAELAVAGVVLVLTAVLVALPMPS